jgi:hypothetical protein
MAWLLEGERGHSAWCSTAGDVRECWESGILVKLTWLSPVAILRWRRG